MAPSVSVALCTHNGARFLPDQVQSICIQEPPPRQLVLSDDASTDDSVDVVRDTVARCDPDGRIELTVLRNETALGITANFEQAIRACTSELIALSDQDDVWHTGRLARMTAWFEAQPRLLLLCTDARLVDDAGQPLGQTLFQAHEVLPHELESIRSGRAFEALVRRNLATGATVIFRRALLDTALPFPSEWLHDEWLAAIAAASGTVDVLAEPLIDYRQHDANQLGARRPGLREKVGKAFAPRGEKFDQRLRRAQQLDERLNELGDRVPAEWRDTQHRKVAHQRFRADLSKHRPLRLVPVLSEAARGGYHRFARGWQSVVQDLLEKG